MDDQDIDTRPVGSSCDRELLRTRERVSTKAKINQFLIALDKRMTMKTRSWQDKSDYEIKKKHIII